MRRSIVAIVGVALMGGIALGAVPTYAAITVLGVDDAPETEAEPAPQVDVAPEVDITPGATPQGEIVPVTAENEAPPRIGECAVLPAENIWNRRVDDMPVHPQSAAWVAAIGADDHVQPDFGAGLYENQPIGVPYVVVPFQQPKVEIHFEGYADEPEGMGDESDPGPYPIPPDAPIEGGINGTSDRHVVVVQDGGCTLYELYKAVPNADGSWNAVGAAKFDLEGNILRIDGWTSADAAGLPIFPGLVRYDEVMAGAINHALRFTAPDTAPIYVWPARHKASHSGNMDLAPMGQRFRLRADFDISGYSPANQVILTALKRYGMFLADNGSPWFLTGQPHDGWDNDDVSELRQVMGSAFEAVDTSGLMIDPDSGAALQPNMPRPRPN